MTSAAQGALAFGVTRAGIFGATSRSVRKSQLKHMQRSLWLRVRGSGAESGAAVRFDALKKQEAHNASMASLVKFREGAGASMVEDLV